ncbi:MAG: hypothetical protein K6F34_07925 [Lachnospiraceae bacterium]|nr:hypothetical protein [Lachnospiraceae bacterium]
MSLSVSRFFDNRSKLIPAAACIGAALVILCLAPYEGTAACIRWLITCLGLALIAWPYLRFLSVKFKDGGFCIRFGISAAFSFVLTWLVCTLFGIPFDTPVCFAIPVCLPVPGILVYIKNRKNMNKNSVKSDEDAVRFITGFAVFVLLFVIAFWIKGYKPYIDHQTEQYMDFGFMKAIFRQKAVPFEDIWMSGKAVNYYYLGQAFAVFMCRLSGVSVDHGYDLMLCMIFAFLALGIFSLTEILLSGQGGLKQRYCTIGGVASSAMCSLGGNGHWIVYGLLSDARKALHITEGGKRYWFPTSTMFIGYDPVTYDKGKHEFPSYTLILGDLHAHVINMIFTITLLMVLTDYAFKEKKEDRYAELFSPHVMITAVLLGLFKGINFWDYPIYYVTAGAVILFADIKKYRASAGTIVSVLLKGLMIYGIGTLVMLPFTLHYSNPSGGIHLCGSHTPLWQFMLIWSVHVITAVSLLVYFFGSGIRKAGAGLVTAAAYAMCGLGLLVMPEVIYVRDIYGMQYQRYNTMFKLTFQAFILLSISAGVCIGLFFGKKKLKLIAAMYSVLVLMLAGYAVHAAGEWFGNIFDPAGRKDVCATGNIWTDDGYSDIRQAADIINRDSSLHIHIIEEGGDSYTNDNRLSVLTGASDVAGWYVHEWVWRNDTSLINARRADIRDFYTLGDRELCRNIADKYGLDYIYVGARTASRYKVNRHGFEGLGEHVWESEDGEYMLIRVDTRNGRQ